MAASGAPGSPKLTLDLLRSKVNLVLKDVFTNLGGACIPPVSFRSNAVI